MYIQYIEIGYVSHNTKCFIDFVLIHNNVITNNYKTMYFHKINWVHILNLNE